MHQGYTHTKGTRMMEFRKITATADSRMRTRTAKEQLAQALAEANRPQEESIPDPDDSSLQGYWPSNERPM